MEKGIENSAEDREFRIKAFGTNTLP